MKKILFIFALVCLNSYGQNYQGIPYNQNNSWSNSGTDIRLGDALRDFIQTKKETTIDLEEVKGSPYFHDKFYGGMVTGERLGMRLRYNANTDQFELPGNAFIIPFDGMEIKIALKGSRWELWKYSNGYWSTSLGKDIWVRPVRKFKRGRPSRNSFVPAVPASFSKLDKYYSRSEDGRMVAISKRKANRLLKKS